MSKPQRSLRLEKRSARSLEVLSGAPGEIFFDNDNGTLRVYTDNAGDSIILANRQWVTDNTKDYNSLINTPTLSSVAASGDYNDLINVPAGVDISTLTNIGDVYVDNLQQDDALVWDGSLWTNRPPVAAGVTVEYVDNAINNLISAAPTALDTLNELATALGNDPNFETTVATALISKAPVANPTFTGTVTAPTISAGTISSTNTITLSALQGVVFTPLSVAPTTPAAGTVAVADGITWDPAGTGTEAMVVYLGGAWQTIVNA